MGKIVESVETCKENRSPLARIRGKLITPTWHPIQGNVHELTFAFVESFHVSASGRFVRHPADGHPIKRIFLESKSLRAEMRANRVKRFAKGFSEGWKSGCFHV